MSDQTPAGAPQPSVTGGTPPPPPAPGWGGPPPPPPSSPGGSSAHVPPAPGYGQQPGHQGGYGPPMPTGRRPGELLDRFLARLMDHLLVGVVNAIVVSVVIVGAVLNSDGGYLGYGGGILAGIVSAVLGVAIGMGYFVYMETSQGRTLGKMVMKLRVEGASGAKPTVQESVKRNIWMALPLLGIVPVIGGLVGAIAQLVAVILIAVGISNDTARRRPWTDQLADTQVLKE